MASRTTYEMMHPQSEVQMLTPKAVGAAAANLVVDPLDRDLASGTFSATGIFNLVFKKKYPQGLAPLSPGIVGTTTGLVGTFTAWDPAAGTATVKFAVGGVATNPAATDSIRFCFVVRNSNKN